MRARASRAGAGAPLAGALLALLVLCAPLCSFAAFTLPSGQDLLSLRAIAAVSGGKSILTHGTTWTDVMGTTWADGPNAGTWSPSSMSGLNYGTVYSDGTGNGPLWQTSGDIMSVCMANELIGWAVGNGGKIIFTPDGGQNWVDQVSPTGTDLDLYSVACLSPTSAIAVGEQGVILRTTNAGLTWTRVTANSFVDLFCVSFGDANKGIASGLNGQIFATTNGGATWTDARPAISNQRTTSTLLACSVAPGTTVAYVGGTGGVVMTTANFAAGNGAAVAFTKVPTATSLVAAAAGDPNLLDAANTAVTSIAFADANNGWLVTSNGGIVGLRGGGNNWAQQRAGPGSTSHLRDIACLSASNAYAVGNGGQLLVTTDGLTWTADSSNFPASTTVGVADIIAIATLPLTSLPPLNAPPPPVASPPPRPPLPPLPPVLLPPYRTPLPAPPPPLPPIPPPKPPTSPPPPPQPSPPPSPPTPPSPPPSPPSPPRPPLPPPVIEHCKSPTWALPAFIAAAGLDLLLFIACIVMACMLCARRQRVDDDSAYHHDKEAQPVKQAQARPPPLMAPPMAGAPGVVRTNRYDMDLDGNGAARPPAQQLLPAEELPPRLAAALGVTVRTGSPRQQYAPPFAPVYDSVVPPPRADASNVHLR